ncbi:hypothetical protein SLEP1_g18788 [Rubroshorea leprosula]|uniref:Uncharacterized protein n=1 Tax=Rubroshorea leprosula TaxID=152421 RepID=A0AAV5J9B6_9ROSI|nr:hypothetical protein SLEP1_g18788 [Rubroshorea leprosula]
MANQAVVVENKVDQLTNQVAQLKEELEKNKAERKGKISKAITIATMNNTIAIYNEVHGKVLQHRPDFSIRELAFIKGEEIDEQRQSLAPPFEIVSM